MKRVLFLCTGNSCRSQMAEGWLRQLAGDRYESLSAGSKPSGYVHPKAVEAMAEVGVDISDGVSKSINDFLPPQGTPPDLVLSVCDGAAEECPVFPGPVEQVHVPFDDPAHATGTEDEVMAVFRRVRDEIRDEVRRRFVDA
ncbi:MAG: arsenate reductase ArsC [Planctomycetota bacterium]